MALRLELYKQQTPQISVTKTGLLDWRGWDCLTGQESTKNRARHRPPGNTN
jgi:hypothetical protein